jgi:hypothetical protein
VRTFLTIILFVGLSGISPANGQEVKTGGLTFSVGLESFPGKTYYRLECVRYEGGDFKDYKTIQGEDDMNALNLTLRVAKMAQIGSSNFSAGVEVGASVPVSGYEKSWDLPALTSDLTAELHFSAFC